MRTLGRWRVAAAMLVAMLGVGPARAASNPNGAVFRAVGWYKGRSTVSSGTITCEIPTITSAIADGAFAVGLWNTYGFQTIFFPDPNQPFANPCGGWLQLRNNLIDQAIVIDSIDLRFSLAGARRYRAFIPIRNGFPVACRAMRRATLFAGSVLNPVNSTDDVSGSGAPNVTFVQAVPMISPELVNCLRSQFTPLSTSTFTSIPIVATVTAHGTSDSGDQYRSNTVRYTTNLRHTCGNGRVDDGEFCDPYAPSTCSGFCKIAQGEAVGTCSQDDRLGCKIDANCRGDCLLPGDPSECICAFH
jgi:hypothetical protein